MNKIEELRKLTTEELNNKIKENKEELFNLRFQVGKVVSDKNDKTITVLVETYKKHPKYGKRVKSSKKYCAHDETNKAKVGDIVRIVETRPISKTKRFYLAEVVQERVIL